MLNQIKKEKKKKKTKQAQYISFSTGNYPADSFIHGSMQHQGTQCLWHCVFHQCSSDITKLSIFLSSQGIIQQIVSDMGGRSTKVPSVFHTVYFGNKFLTLQSSLQYISFPQGIIQQIVSDMGGHSTGGPNVFDTVYFINVVLTLQSSVYFFLHKELSSR